MNTLQRFARSLVSIPAATGRYLADLGEGIGRSPGARWRKKG
jgi:hypothetical protein